MHRMASTKQTVVITDIWRDAINKALHTTAAAVTEWIRPARQRADETLIWELRSILQQQQPAPPLQSVPDRTRPTARHCLQRCCYCTTRLLWASITAYYVPRLAYLSIQLHQTVCLRQLPLPHSWPIKHASLELARYLVVGDCCYRWPPHDCPNVHYRRSLSQSCKRCLATWKPVQAVYCSPGSCALHINFISNFISNGLTLR